MGTLARRLIPQPRVYIAGASSRSLFPRRTNRHRPPSPHYSTPTIFAGSSDATIIRSARLRRRNRLREDFDPDFDDADAYNRPPSSLSTSRSSILESGTSPSVASSPPGTSAPSSYASSSYLAQRICAGEKNTDVMEGSSAASLASVAELQTQSTLIGVKSVPITPVRGGSKAGSSDMPKLWYKLKSNVKRPSTKAPESDPVEGPPRGKDKDKRKDHGLFYERAYFPDHPIDHLQLVSCLHSWLSYCFSGRIVCSQLNQYVQMFSNFPHNLSDFSPDLRSFIYPMMYHTDNHGWRRCFICLIFYSLTFCLILHYLFRSLYIYRYPIVPSVFILYCIVFNPFTLHSFSLLILSGGNRFFRCAEALTTV